MDDQKGPTYVALMARMDQLSNTVEIKINNGKEE